MGHRALPQSPHCCTSRKYLAAPVNGAVNVLPVVAWGDHWPVTDVADCKVSPLTGQERIRPADERENVIRVLVTVGAGESEITFENKVVSVGRLWALAEF